VLVVAPALWILARPPAAVAARAAAVAIDAERPA